MRRVLILVVVLLFAASMVMAQDDSSGGVSVPAAPAADDEDLESQRDALVQAIDSKGGISFHKDMFLAPLTYNERFTGSDSEVIFQLSLKARILGGPLYFGYTQRSFWQAYNGKESAPFRETLYNPEVFFRFQPGNRLSSQWGFDLGIEHESNGK